MHHHCTLAMYLRTLFIRRRGGIWFDRIFNLKVYRVIFSCLQAMILCCVKCSVHRSVLEESRVTVSLYSQQRMLIEWYQEVW